MKFKGFSIFSEIYIPDAYCECGTNLKMVSNGWISRVMFCPKCESVYELKLIKIPKNKVTKKFIKQSRMEIKGK